MPTLPAVITFTASTTSVGANTEVAIGFNKMAKIVGPVDASGNPQVTLKRSSISGTAQFAVIGSSADLSIDGLAIENGYTPASGGGVSAYGSNLTLAHCTLANNHAHNGGGVFANNTLTVTDCRATDNVATIGAAFSANTSVNLTSVTVEGNTAAGAGGGVFALGSVIIANSTFSGNAALAQGTSYRGGGAVFTSNAILTNTTVSGNRSGKDGGGVYSVHDMSATACTFSGNTSDRHGGAIATSSDNGTLTLTNSTVSGNTASSAGGGIFAHAVNLSYSSVFANQYTTAGSKGAGVYFVTSAQVYASILKDNGSYDIGAPSNIAVTGGYNIIGSGVSTPIDTRNCTVNFGPLANFGGSTKTLPLLNGSCAIDTGPFIAVSVTTDQRGQTRPVQVSGAVARLDVGAFEKQSATDPDYIFINGFGNSGSD